MLGGWWFGGSPSSPDSNFLRVHNAFPPNRRLSDNQLIGPPKIRIAPSCASSPGGTPGGSGGLPIRRHSSIGPQERRGSAINLSPPTVCFHYILSHLRPDTSPSDNIKLILVVFLSFYPNTIGIFNLWTKLANFWHLLLQIHA